ncbi:MAG: TonB-dependent receptor, partial [Bacteroidales bacterium]|nr:TonB-dependent receptor [Bacteroidales bacterium]
DYNYALKDFSGSSIPKVFGGFNFKLQWKDIDFGATFSYQLGGKLLDSNYARMMSMSEYGYSMSPDLNNAWHQEGDITDVPRIDNNATHASNIGQSYSTRWLTSSNYLNLRSVSLGYQLPKNIIKKVFLKSARINLTAENLFLIKARQGLNPMAQYNGLTYNEYMPNRTITIGVNLSF